MKRQFLSIILSVTLLASAIAGAISVSIKFANADSIVATDSAYFMEFLDDIIALQPSYEDDITDFFNFANSYVSDIEENENIIVLLAYYDGEYVIDVISNMPSTMYYTQDRWGDQYGIGDTTSYNSFRTVRLLGELRISSSVYYLSTSETAVSSWGTTAFGSRGLINYASYYHLFPSPALFNRSGLSFYSSKPILSGSWSTSTSAANLFAGVSIRYCHLRQFTMGTRKLVCLQEQNLVYAFKDDLWSTSHVEAYVVDKDSNLVQVDFRWSEMLAIDNIALYVQDVSGLGDETAGYAWIINDDWYSIGSFDIVYWSIDIWRHIWVTENVPFVLNQDTPDQLADQQLTEAWNQFNTYVETYNQTHVIPEQLADWLFEQNGSKLFPVTVSVPGNIWLPDHGSAYTQHNWIWGGLNAATEAFAYDLFDVCICGANNLNLTLDRNYQLRYFVDDLLDPMYNNVSKISFSELIDSFDIVIIVPEDEGYLHDVSLTSNIAYCGSSGNSIIYQGSAITGNNLTGFAIVTERGISKQQLWNFNDGISKLYDLEVQYIDSEDSWKDSFLLWSASIFDMLNSLDGRLTAINSNLLSISSLIDHIKNAVDHIAYDDNPENLQPWYLSLWNWISNFRPSDSDFATTLTQYNDNWDDFPELPAPSTVPLLPGGE